VSKKPSRAVAKRKPARVPQVRTPKTKKKSASGIDADLVRDLAKVLDDTGLTEIEVEYGELRLRLARHFGDGPTAASTHACIPAR
jgi:acetyl-CoA carboxylase biotin carboxyl carrier protein